jgi:hypothetical protein
MNKRQRKAYEEMVAAGESESIAEILATGQAPGLQTDTRFLHGKNDNGFYSHQLQRWVSSRADVKRICAEKNWDCEGSVSHKSVWDKPRADEQPYKVADDLVDNYVKDITDEYPDAERDDPELRTKLATKLAGDA